MAVRADHLRSATGRLLAPTDTPHAVTLALVIQPRLALSGSAGTGKTTLGRRLAAELGIPYIEEGMRRRIEQGLAWHELRRDQQLALIEELWAEQLAAEEAAPDGFVADRSSYDYAAFWLHYDFHADRLDTSDRFEAWCAAGQRYDRILLLPWGVLPLEADGVRSPNRFVQLRYQGILEAVIRHHAAEGQVHAIGNTMDLEERVRAALASLDRGDGGQAPAS